MDDTARDVGEYPLILLLTLKKIHLIYGLPQVYGWFAARRLGRILP
jgi:hypothetical protein